MREGWPSPSSPPSSRRSLWRGYGRQAREGYLYNENPIPEAATLFNVQLPAFNQSQLSGGLTTKVSKAVSLDVGVTYIFEDELAGPILQIPGTEVAINQSLIAFDFATRVAF